MLQQDPEKSQEDEQDAEDGDRQEGNPETPYKDSPYQHTFLFDQNSIKRQYFNWEKNISISANKSFDQYAIICTPDDHGNPTYMVDGPAFRKEGTREEGEFGIDELDIPYYIQIPKGSYVEHGRNAHIKDELYYYQHIKNPKDVNEVKTVCLRLANKDIKKQMNAS